MTNRTLTAAILSLGVAFILTTPARADIIQTLSLPSPGYYDSPDGYDFSSPANDPPPGSTTIGTFTFTIPTGDYVTGINLTGTFGNGDSPTTALSDYYLGYGGNEIAVPVANCDSISANCYSDEGGPTAWTSTLTSANLSTLNSAIASGSLDFTYIWGNSPSLGPGIDQYVYAGAPTIDIQVAPTPEPASVLLLFSALAGIAVLRRFRRV